MVGGEGVGGVSLSVVVERGRASERGRKCGVKER